MHDSIVVVFTGGSEPGGMCNSDREPCSASRHNVLDKRVGQASESVTPPTSSTSFSVQLNNVIRQYIVTNRAN
jgi:hypothetical protein